MKTEFDLAEKMKQCSLSIKRCPALIQKIIAKNVEKSGAVMVESAKMHTPNSNDGKPRGMNMISNSLQDSWRFESRFIGSSSGISCVISLINDVPYAPFVQNGHKVSKHFVPWLYKDRSGLLSYDSSHSLPMKGIVVGTKTHYVKGVDMVGPAMDAFDSDFLKRCKSPIMSIIMMALK